MKPNDLAGIAVVLAALSGAIFTGLTAVRPPPASTAANAPEMALETTRALTIAVQDGALPLAGTEPDGRPAGLHVAVARAVCEKLSVECAFAVTAADHVITRLESGAVDMIAADLAITPDRAARVRYLRPHARAASLFLGRSSGRTAFAPGAAPAEDPAVLAGRVAVAASGTDQARALADLVPPDATLVLAQHPRDGVAALRRGDADVALLPLALALDVLADPDESELVALGSPMTAGTAGGPVALAVAIGDDTLAEAANAALTSLERDGTLRRLASVSGDPGATVIPPLPTPLSAARMAEALP